MTKVSKQLCDKVGNELIEAMISEIKTRGLVKGKISLTYGEDFRVKFQAHSNDEVTRSLASEVTEAIKRVANDIFDKNNLVMSSINTKYGTHYQVIISADAVEIGKNGVNIASKDAYLFSLYAWQYSLTNDALGNEATINGKKWRLAGLQVKANKHKLVILDEKNQSYTVNDDAIVHFGGKAIETLKAMRA